MEDSFRFLNKWLDVLGDDVLAFVHEFCHIIFILKGCNSSSVTLISKVDNPLFIKDYHCISVI